jgi:hypothetical protein
VARTTCPGDRHVHAIRSHCRGIDSKRTARIAHGAGAGIPRANRAGDTGTLSAIGTTTPQASDFVIDALASGLHVV